MMRRFLATLALCALAACASPTIDCPREGGIGGTGGCPPSQQLE